MLRSWGCFVLAFAGITHVAPSFPGAAQQSLGASMAGCFLLLTLLYGHAIGTYVLAADTSEVPPAYRVGIAATGSVFAALFVAYTGPLLHFAWGAGTKALPLSHWFGEGDEGETGQTGYTGGGKLKYVAADGMNGMDEMDGVDGGEEEDD